MFTPCVGIKHEHAIALGLDLFWQHSKWFPQRQQYRNKHQRHANGVTKQVIQVTTGEGVLEVTEVQPANSKRLTVAQFLAGHRVAAGQRFDAGPPPPNDHEAARPRIKRLVHDLVDEMGGAISAEHGIGRLKVADLERYGDPAKLAAMRAIKDALDPQGIMNPGAVLR